MRQNLTSNLGGVRLLCARLRLVSIFLWAVYLGSMAAYGSEEPATLQLLVQPQSWHASTIGVTQLARYLQQSTDIVIQARQSEDSLSHWRSLREKHASELVLDEAQFTDYLIQRRHYTVLAQSSRPMRFILAVRPGMVFTDPSDLSARQIAVPAPPSLAALRLLELYPLPTHVPIMRQFKSLPVALRALAAGHVQAIVLPMLDGHDDRRLETTLVTDASPGVGFSASPQVSAVQRRRLARALLNAHRSPLGRKALMALDIPFFELSSASSYEGSSTLLSGTWGYSNAN